MNTQKKIGLSVIIPVYNAEAWVVPTLEHIVAALSRASFSAEIIVIDDGSSDESADNAEKFVASKDVPVKVIRQKNAGRYLARKKGVEVSSKENILFVDSRVYVSEGSLKFLGSRLTNDSDQLWNGHVNIDKKGNPFARFWDAIVCIAWRKYFRHPKTTSYGLKEFDYYPKGTGFFYVSKKRLQVAMKYFELQTNDLRFSSDDTLLIRFLIKEKNINLSPGFSCLYHGRSNMQSFLKHAYSRGQFFIDGFLRPGNRFFIPLLAVLALSIIVVVSFFVWPLQVFYLTVAAAVLFIIGLFMGALFFGVVAADAAALALLGVPFTIVYLCGLWRGVIRIVSGDNGKKDGLK